MRERGSASVLLAGVLGLAAVTASLVADLSSAAVARSRAQAAADAAALAAAQELILPSGRTPAEVAAEYAERAGTWLAACACPPGGGDVVVEVEVPVDLLGVRRTVGALARAVVEVPAGAEGLQPWFVARVGCLLGRVPGTRIVSGFRTHAEQAGLFRRKPSVAAPPGTSMHEVGLAADLSFPSPGAQVEAHREAAGCGLEFPVPHEPWHAEPLH